MKAFLAGLAVASALISIAPPAAAQGTTALDSIVAVADEDVILRSELDIAVANLQAQYAGSGQQLPPVESLRRQVLERLILIKLQVRRARAGGIRIADAELEQALQQVAGNNQMTLDQLRVRLAQDGLTYESFRDSIRDEMLVQRLRQRYVQARVNVSESEIDQLLAVREVGGPEVRLANIVVGLPDGATAEQIETARQKAASIRDLIVRGEMNFSTAAIRYSDAQNALNGGEIGWRGFDAIPPLFVNLIRGMQPGDISEPVRGPSGYQLIQLMETRQAGQQSVTEYNARGLYVRVTPTMSPEAARQKVEQLRARMLAGEPFDAIARAESDDSLTRAAGGDMGWFQANQYGSAIASQITSLQDGQLSAPFQSDVGWHLVLRVGSRQSDVTDENRRNMARELIGERKAEEEYERFLRQIRSEAYVENRLIANF
jgi:peptidyl-prolyl cis-trans isomerase SurA